MCIRDRLHVIVDAHIYDRHVDIVRELIARPQYSAPRVSLDVYKRQALEYVKVKETISNAELEDSMYASRLDQLDEQMENLAASLENRRSRAEELDAELTSTAQRREEMCIRDSLCAVRRAASGCR